MQPKVRRMIDRGLSLLAAGVAASALAGPLAAQQKGANDPIHGLNGSWERYPSRSSGLGSEHVDGPPGPERAQADGHHRIGQGRGVILNSVSISVKLN